MCTFNVGLVSSEHTSSGTIRIFRGNFMRDQEENATGFSEDTRRNQQLYKDRSQKDHHPEIMIQEIRHLTQWSLSLVLYFTLTYCFVNKVLILFLLTEK